MINSLWADQSNEPDLVSGSGAVPAVVNRREFIRVGLMAAAMLAATGCAYLRGSKNDLDTAISDLRKTLDTFEADDARKARLASIGRRIENRCIEFTELYLDYRRRLDTLSRQRSTPTALLKVLVDDFSTRRKRYRNELLGVQEELRQELTREEWGRAIRVLNSKTDAKWRTKKQRS
ncbi:MAG: hypothetical protein KJP06_07605 [Deltaproteobacteria bacterium]|nr:hypothetical protein [Deltaproteobacteria bacterium]